MHISKRIFQDIIKIAKAFSKLAVKHPPPFTCKPLSIFEPHIEKHYPYNRYTTYKAGKSPSKLRKKAA